MHELDIEFEEFKSNKSIFGYLFNSTPVLCFRMLLEIALTALTFYQDFSILFKQVPFSSDFLMASSITELVCSGLKVFFQLPCIWFPVLTGTASIQRAYFDMENKYADLLFFTDIFTSTALNVLGIISIIDCPAASGPITYVNLAISSVLLLLALIKDWPKGIALSTRIVWTIILIAANIVPCVVIGLKTTNHHCYVATCSSLIKDESYQFITGKFAPITFDTHDWRLEDTNPINICPFIMKHIVGCSDKETTNSGIHFNNNSISIDQQQQWNISLSSSSSTSLFSNDSSICLNYNSVHYDGDILSKEYPWTVITDNFLINYCQPNSFCDPGDFQIAPMSCDKSWICSLELVSPESLEYYDYIKRIFSN
ncbi:hypothetical protein ACTFIU_005968 [Dictyostelium citrinum]